MHIVLTKKSYFSLSILFCGLLTCTFANKVENDESCRVYAGGQVYPQERRTSEHALHWSKAQSKLFVLFYSCSSIIILRYAIEILRLTLMTV